MIKLEFSGKNENLENLYSSLVSFPVINHFSDEISNDSNKCVILKYLCVFLLNVLIFGRPAWLILIFSKWPIHDFTKLYLSKERIHSKCKTDGCILIQQSIKIALVLFQFTCCNLSLKKIPLCFELEYSIKRNIHDNLRRFLKILNFPTASLQH